MSPALARRMDRIAIPATIRMSAEARRLRAAGHDVLSLTLGEPDFATPARATEAGFAAARAGETKYPPLDGTPALKAAVAADRERRHGAAPAADEILITNGGKQAIFNALMATLDDGDEVVIPTPCWASYADMARTAGGVPVAVPCDAEDGFRPRAASIAAALSARTKWLMLNSPNNPSGAVLSAADLDDIAEVLRGWPAVWAMSDDMYEHLVFAGAHATLAAVAPDLRERVLTVAGVSKTYAMTGWRVGWGIGPRRLIAAMTNMQSQATSGVSSVGQAAAAAALAGGADEVATMRETYWRRRDLVVDGLAGCQGLRCHRPEGAFYVFPSVAGCLGMTSTGGRRIETDEDFVMALLAEEHVATVPGTAFGAAGYVRLSTAAADAVLREAVARIRRFCEGLG